MMRTMDEAKLVLFELANVLDGCWAESGSQGMAVTAKLLASDEW